jgi:hypothetical protein
MYMKKMSLFLLMGLLLGFGLVVIGCDDGKDEEPTKPDYTSVDYVGNLETDPPIAVVGFEDVAGTGHGLYTHLPHTVYTYTDGHKEVSFNYDPAVSPGAGVVAWVDLPRNYTGDLRATLTSEMKFTDAASGKAGLAWGTNTSNYPKFDAAGSNIDTAGKDAWVTRSGTLDFQVTTGGTEEIQIDFGWDNGTNAADKTAKKYFVRNISITVQKLSAVPTVFQNFEAINGGDLDWVGWNVGDVTNTVETDSTKYVKSVVTNYNAGVVFPVDLGTHTISEFTDVYFKANVVKPYTAGYVAIAQNKTDLAENNVNDNDQTNHIAGDVGIYGFYSSLTANTWGAFSTPFYYGTASNPAGPTQIADIGALTGQVYVAIVYNENAVGSEISIDDFGFIGKVTSALAPGDWAP